MLKRHYGASLRDWLGAAEYALLEGCDKIILCERGMSTPHTHRATSRFMLDLQVIPAAKEITSIPLASDPSHATFWRKWVEPMALASIAVGAEPINFKDFSKLMKKMDAVAKSIKRSVL